MTLDQIKAAVERSSINESHAAGTYLILMREGIIDKLIAIAEAAKALTAKANSQTSQMLDCDCAEYDALDTALSALTP